MSIIEFKTWYRVAEALNVAGLILLVFLLASFLCLPAEKTRRHYLSYCLIIGGIFMAVSNCASLWLRAMADDPIARVRDSVRVQTTSMLR